MTYSEALQQVETIVKQLESSDAISPEEYKEKAAKAKELLDFCEGEVKQLAQSFR